MKAPHLVVVPHTHWDREWYRTHEEFRIRLVRLLDQLLDLLERDSAFRHFTLDGQTIVVDDYLAVRPHARERIAKLVGTGRLLVGPWTVLPDEWLVSGEALVRNLRLGLARAAELGGGMRIGYVPDQFGHVGQLPQIFAGFGFEGAVVWRGVGEDVAATTFLWEAPDGTGLFTVYLPRGYGNAAHLPTAPAALAARLRQEIDGLAVFSRIPTLLLMNGSDHLEPEPALPAALAAALDELGATGEIGTLPGFVARARGEAPADLPRHRGELRSGLRAPLLPGCASARLPQKRADFENDRLLVRYLEPLAAWLEVLGGDGDPELVEYVWRIALENHPHDSICGCSVDAVHRQMDARFARVAELAGAHLRRVASDLAGRVVPVPGAGEPVAVWNPHAPGRYRAEGVLALDAPAAGGAAPALHLRGADGRRLPAHVECLQPGDTLACHDVPVRVAAMLAGGLPPEFFGQPVEALGVRDGGGRLEVEGVLGDAAPAGFDFERAKAEVVAALEARGDGLARFTLRRRPRFRVRFVDDLPGCGIRTYRAVFEPAEGEGAPRAERLANGGAAIENETWRVEVAPDGRVAWRHGPTGERAADALRLVSEGDRGDEYDFDPVPEGERVERAQRVRVRLLRGSQAEVGIALQARYRVPQRLAGDRRRRSARRVTLPARVELRLATGLDALLVHVEVTNTAEDHRLRVHLRAPFAATSFAVESAFEVAARPIAPGPGDFGSARPAELPTGVTPQRAFATLAAGPRALTLANRGSAEIEAVPETDGATAFAVTLVRAVGWLSRDDLVQRPGHAGPPLATPEAQGKGPHRADLSLRCRAADARGRSAAAHGFAAPPLLFAGSAAPARGPAGPAGSGLLRDGDRLCEVDDPEVVVSAIEPRVEGAPVVRLYNASDAPRRVRVRWNGPGAGGLERVDFCGTPLSPERVEELALRPWEIANLRPR